MGFLDKLLGRKPKSDEPQAAEPPAPEADTGATVEPDSHEHDHDHGEHDHSH